MRPTFEHYHAKANMKSRTKIVIFKFIWSLCLCQCALSLHNSVPNKATSTITVDQPGKESCSKVRQDALNSSPAGSNKANIECKTSQSPSKVAYEITVSQSGGANFTTITDALKSVPSGNDKWIKILLKPGNYKEQIQIPQDKGCIVLEGSGLTTTTITFDDHSTTLQSCTFAVYSDDFVAKGVTFKNSFNGRPSVVPAVAFRSYGDKHAFYSCGFVGYQDTLWDDKGRHYFQSCYIEGAVDFIWGGGQSVYEQCAINVVGGGFITAQGRSSAADTSGYVLRGCNVSGAGLAHLGRAYNAFSRVIFIDSKFSSCVDPEGWNIWEQKGHENDVTYAEINCSGPGADISKRVPWEKKLGTSEIDQYTKQAFIDQDGWIAKQPA